MGDSITTCKIRDVTKYGQDNPDKTIAENIAETSKRLMNEIKKDTPELPEGDFNNKLQEIKEFLWKGNEQQYFLSDNLPLATIQSIVIEQINLLLHNWTKNNSPIEITKRQWLKILKDNNTNFSIKYYEETNDKWETSQKIRFNDKLYTEVKKRKNFDLSYNITKNEIEIDGKRYSLTEEQWKTMLNAISQMITATEDKYKNQRQNKASR